MKFKRLLALILVFTLLGVATVFADTAYEKYLATKVSLKVNGATISSPGLEVDMGRNKSGIITKIMVPLDEIVSSLGGTYKAEDKGINIYKPNVQMSVVLPEDNKSIRVVEKGIKLPFKVFAYMDSILVDISNIKITVVDPFGSEIESLEYKYLEEDLGKEVFSYFSKPMEVKIKYIGHYSVNLQIKEVGGSEYYNVGRYVIYSESK